MNILPILISFLIGVCTGAAGKYFADKYTDKRRTQESKSRSKKLFRQVSSKMPKLIKEMQEDLLQPEFGIVRELYVIPNRRVAFNSREKYLSYYETEHPNLRHKLKLLENNGFIQDVTRTNTTQYRMSEQFASYVLEAKIKSDRVKI